MEPLNDDELDHLLRQWKAPAAPPSLEEKFFPRGERLPWWRWLWSGTIPIPVPVGLVAAAILVAAVLFGISNYPPRRPVQSVTLADFQPVKQLQPRIIRNAYVGN